MSIADGLILFATTGYFGAAVCYLLEGSPAKAAIFCMYGMCNILISLSPS